MVDLGPGDRVANRYRVLRLLGTGGMASVYEVFDETRGTSVAMKHLSRDAASQRSATLLFRREYTTLAQLAHPLIIRAYDYGVDDERPYYTMELLSGQDLRTLAPLPCERASSLLRDVASALAILHSRRLVHRDVSARNVRSTADGRAKLLDFGATCPMGVAYEVAGTPPFVPPESLEGQPLEGRSDLFALGGVAYYLLTGRHAYPASRLSELHGTWSRGVEPPSALVPGIPESMDALVTSLLSLNPRARPASAAEVCDRLTAMAELPPLDTLELARSYLVTPTLIARDDALARFRRRLLRAERRVGSTLLIEGEEGVGRSRLLSTLATEARLRGMVVLYAEGEQGQAGPFAVARALANRLVEAGAGSTEPQDLEVLRCVGAGNSGAAPPQVIEQDAWPEIAGRLADWFIRVGSRVALALAIDDIDESDEASLAVLAKVAAAARSERILVTLTCRPSSASAVVQRFKRIGGSHVIKPFRPAETEALVRSIFGDVPHLEGVARWVHGLSDGNPRTAIDLARHLVEQGVARYDNGAWVLPLSPTSGSLPHDLHQAFDAKIRALSPPARHLAESLALTLEQDPLLLEEYPALVGEEEVGGLMVALDELVAAAVLVPQGSAYVFAHQALRQAVQRGITEDRRAEAHRRIAWAYAASSSEPSALAAYHLFKAGENAAAFSTLVASIAERKRPFTRGRSSLTSLEGERFREKMFEWGQLHGASKVDVHLAGKSLLQVAAIANTNLARHAPAVLTPLERDTGLVYWDEFEDTLDPLERIRRCVRRAFAVYEATPERERGLDPIRAIQDFAVCTAMLAGVYARAFDPEGALALTVPIDRLRPLSPAVDLVANIVLYTANARRGWVARELRLRVLEQLAEPVVGIDEPSRVGLQMVTRYYQALEDAVMGDPGVFDRVASLEQHAPYAPLAWQARMIAHLFHGAEKQAESCRQKRDLAMTGRPDVDGQLETSVAYEATAYSILGDLMALKRILPALEDLSRKWPGWTPLWLLANSAYYGLRGDLGEALELASRARDLVKAGRHPAWILAVIRVARLSLQLGRVAEAHELAASALAECEHYPLLPPYVDQLEMTLALAEARQGGGEAATRRAERVVARSEAIGTAGILLIELYALHAEIAQTVEDRALFESVSRKIGAMCVKVDSAAFATRLSSVLNLSLGAGFEPLGASTGILVRRGLGPALISSKIRTELEVCRGAEERARRALDIVLEHSRATRGFLYLNQEHGPVLASSRSDSPPPIQTEEFVLKWLQEYSGHSEETTTKSGGSLGHRFKLVALVTKRDDHPIVAGVVVIHRPRHRTEAVSEAVLSALAHALLEAGDASDASAPSY
jgi:hypothetical protein